MGSSCCKQMATAIRPCCSPHKCRPPKPVRSSHYSGCGLSTMLLFQLTDESNCCRWRPRMILTGPSQSIRRFEPPLLHHPQVWPWMVSCVEIEMRKATRLGFLESSSICRLDSFVIASDPLSFNGRHFEDSGSPHIV